MQRTLATRCAVGPPAGGPSRRPAATSAAPAPLLRAAAAPPAAPATAPTSTSTSLPVAADIPALERAFDAPEATPSSRALPMAAGERATPLEAGEARPAQFRSTAEHRAWIAAGTVALAAVYAQAVGGVDGGLDAAAVAAATVAGYYAADFGTGLYHWTVDNYGDGSTPGLGPQIAAFQGHHQRPWTITEREFANNCHTTFKPAAVVSGAWLALAAPAGAPPAASAFFATLIACAALSQQFHAWAHGRPSTVPAPVRALQGAGLLVSAKAHGAHHRAPFEGNYCIVSGAWNGLLDGAGFFRGLEKVVHGLTGVEPRCWSEPNYDWVEGGEHSP